jgi:anti-sigma B factor antagonist
MKVLRSDLEDELRLKIEGALDALTARDVRPLFDQVVADKPRRVTIDLESLTLIDSSGVGAIVSLFKRVKADGGQVVLVHAQDQPLAVLKLLKLDRIFGL